MSSYKAPSTPSSALDPKQPPPPSLSTIASKLKSNPPQKIEQTPRRVRGLFDQQYVFDTTQARHVWEHPYYPLYYIPKDAVKTGLLTIDDKAIEGGDGAYEAHLKGERRTNDRVLVFKKGPLEGLVRFEMDGLDTWFEENEPIYVHPKDPYKRIDILPSSRKIAVKVDGVTIAESGNNMFLFETMLRPRYYMPKTSLNWQYITNSDTTTKCPYKGMAEYYNVVVNGKKYEDVIWWYRYPTAESALVTGMACFYNEKVDVFVDGAKEER